MSPAPFPVATRPDIAPAAAQYDLNTLIQAPKISVVDPLHGPAAGGTLVTVQGTDFAGDATVLFVARATGTSSSGGYLECEWRTAAVPGVMCNATLVRCV